jgi:outer membrane protein assembly factor BamA
MTSRLLALAALLLLLPATLCAQTYTAKSITFRGATGYTDQELLNLSGLKTGTPLSADDINKGLQAIIDSGLFDDASFQYHAGELTFTLVPSASLRDVVLENLPLVAGPDLDARIRAKVPLYRGRVPFEGPLLDAVRKALEDEVSALGIDATIILLKPASDDPTIHFRESIPAVRIGAVNLTGASPELAAGARQALARAANAEFSTLGSPNQLETELGNYYRELAHLQATIHAVIKLPPAITPDGVQVPFNVTVNEGPEFHVGTITLDPSVGLAQSEFEARTALHPGALAKGSLLRGAWQILAEEQHTTGHMRARILPAVSYDIAKGLVSYRITAEPGPQYAMGTFNVDNANDDLKAAILSDWVMTPGVIFNPRRLLGGPECRPTNAALQRYLAHEELHYSYQFHEDTHTIDVTLHLEKRSL